MALIYWFDLHNYNLFFYNIFLHLFCLVHIVVSRPEEIDDANSVSMDTVDLNHFFEENGTIYGYKDLKVILI